MNYVKTLNLFAMKRIFGILILSAFMSLVYGQRSIDALFDKYADDDAFVTITLNGNLLKFNVSKDDDGDDNHWMGRISEIRILAQKDEGVKVENFFNHVVRDINMHDYEEYMSIKKADQDFRMLVRSEGKTFKEFLLIGGGEDNVIIQIKGNMTYDDAEKFSSQVKKENGRDLLSTLE
jgi:hypothetical protein